MIISYNDNDEFPIIFCNDFLCYEKNSSGDNHKN